MYRYLIVTVLLLAACGETHADTRASGFANLSTALTSPATLGQAVVIDRPMTINNKTVLGRTLEIKPGGKITVAAGKNLHFSSSGFTNTGRYQVFDGPGTVTGLREAYPEWWGATGGNAAVDGPAIAKAVQAGTIVDLDERDYRLATRYYLLHPDLATADCLVPIKSNLTIRGKGYNSVLTVEDNVTAGGNYVVIAGPLYEAYNNLLFENFRINGNSANNQTVANPDGSVWDNRNIRRATQILIPKGDNIVVRDMWFEWNPGVWAIKMGADRNTVDVSNIKIIQNTFHGMGAYVSPITRDHSTIYIQADKGMIANNNFSNPVEPAPDVYTTTALEVHGSNITVIGNRVKNYTSLGNAVASVWEGEHNSWIGNTGSGILRFGLGLWSYHYKTYGLNIQGNTFYMRGPNVVGGIFQQAEDTNNTEPVYDLVIDGNTVVGDDPSGSVAYGIMVSNALAGRITNNHIRKISGSGIVVKTNVDVPLSIEDLVIQGNDVADVSWYDATGAAILVWTGSAANTIKNLTIKDNILSRLNNPNDYRAIFLYNPYNTITTAVINGNVFNGFSNSERRFTVYFPGNITGLTSDIITYRSTPPTFGYWNINDRVLQATPTVGQPKAWICTVGGGAYSTTRADNTAYTKGTWAAWPTGTTVWEVTTAGTSTTGAPDIAGKIIGDTVTDGTVTWTLRSTTKATFVSEGNL